MAAAGDDEEYLRHHEVGIPAAFPYAFAFEERPEGDQVEAAAPEELGGGGGPGALDMMRFDQVAYWLLDLHVDPVFDDPHGGGGGGPGALDMMQLDEVAYWLLDLHVLDPVFDDPPGGGGGCPGALDMMRFDQVAYWLLDLHVDPVFDDPHGGGGGGPGALDMMHLDEVAYWLLDLHVDPVFDDPHGGEDATASVSTITAEISIAGDHERMLLPAEIADWDNIDQWLVQVHHDLGAADPHGDDDDSTATSTSAAESWADGGGWEMQIDKGDDDEGELRGHGADDAATASTAESWVGGGDHRLQPYACDCAAAAADLSVEYWWVPEPEPTGPLPDQLALDGDVFLQDLVLVDMQQLLV